MERRDRSCPVILNKIKEYKISKPVRSNTSNSLDSTQLLLVPVSRSSSSLLSLATSFLTFTTRGLENSTNSGALVVTPLEPVGRIAALSVSW